MEDFMKILLLLLLCSGLQAKDLSRFSIHAGSGDNPTKVQFIVTDSQGRKTGFESYVYDEDGDIGVRSYKEISHSNYYTEYVGSLDPTVVPDEPESAIFGMREVIKDTYTIQFIGIDNCKYSVEGYIDDTNGKTKSIFVFTAYITSGTTQQYSLYIDPTPGAPPPTITKIVSFQALRDDFNVAQKLNQIGDDRFVNSWIKMVDIAEKLYNRCENLKSKEKDENKQDKHKRLCYRPVIMILELIKKRLEIVNKICDNPNECKMKCKDKDECNEEMMFDNFRKENIKEEGIKEFFSEWDKDEWHKHKKHCRRFITDEALKIISEDIDWLMKSIGVEKDKSKDKLEKDDIKDLKSEK
jgi:hypothetical protein